VGRPPTGRAVDEWVVTIMHFEDDKVVREWIGSDKSACSFSWVL
jgi:predicted ester cyclase